MKYWRSSFIGSVFLLCHSPLHLYKYTYVYALESVLITSWFQSHIKISWSLSIGSGIVICHSYFRAHTYKYSYMHTHVGGIADYFQMLYNFSRTWKFHDPHLLVYNVFYFIWYCVCMHMYRTRKMNIFQFFDKNYELSFIFYKLVSCIAYVQVQYLLVT